jgi:hypothetical protein
MFVAMMQESIKVSHSGGARSVRVIHDHPLYLVCHDLLVSVGEISCGIWVGFIRSTHSLNYMVMYLYFRCKVYSYPVMDTKIIFSQ